MRGRMGHMPEFLIGFSFHEPEPFAQWQRGLIEDYESSTGIWITADNHREALAWAEQVAQAVHRRVNNDPSADWREAGHFCWLEESPTQSGWTHCLSFFQHVGVGEMPPLEEMGTDAYDRWQKSTQPGPAKEQK